MAFGFCLDIRYYIVKHNDKIQLVKMTSVLAFFFVGKNILNRPDQFMDMLSTLLPSHLDINFYSV